MSQDNLTLTFLTWCPRAGSSILHWTEGPHQPCSAGSHHPEKSQSHEWQRVLFICWVFWWFRVNSELGLSIIQNENGICFAWWETSTQL